MKHPQSRKALIFDMDGTMVDNMMIHHRAWQQRLAEEGLHFTMAEVMQHCHGKNLEILERLFGEKYTEAQRMVISNEKEAIYRNVFRDDLKLINGLHELLAVAFEHEIPIGIGTAAQYDNVNFVLDTLNIRNYFDVIVADVDVAKGKPDPEVFLKVAEKLNIDPKDCLVFEDSPVGAKAAENAGMKAIILTTTHKNSEFENYTTLIKCIGDYTEIDILRELAYL